MPSSSGLPIGGAITPHIAYSSDMIISDSNHQLFNKRYVEKMVCFSITAFFYPYQARLRAAERQILETGQSAEASVQVSSQILSLFLFLIVPVVFPAYLHSTFNDALLIEPLSRISLVCMCLCGYVHVHVCAVCVCVYGCVYVDVYVDVCCVCRRLRTRSQTCVMTYLWSANIGSPSNRRSIYERELLLIPSSGCI